MLPSLPDRPTAAGRARASRLFAESNGPFMSRSHAFLRSFSPRTYVPVRATSKAIAQDTRIMDTITLSLLILQLGIGLTFAVHGAQKVFGWWGGPGLAGWEGAMAHMGFRPARLFAVTSALTELGGGLLLAVGLVTPLAAAALVAQAVVIVGHVHWQNGFFNSKSGIEFPLLLGLGAAAVGIAGGSAVGVDSFIGFTLAPSVDVAAVVAGVVAGLVALTIPRLRSQDAAASA
jgi:putative oxidoreductase